MSCLAILVNYHSARLLVDAVRSLSADNACDAIHVVDNSTSSAEADYLRAHLPGHVKLTISERNLGFAGGCNLAFEQDDAELVLLLNPDARLLPGALVRLKQTLAEDARLAAAGPRVYWDDACTFLLPPTTFPAPASYFLDHLSQRFPRLQDWRARRWRNRALREWQASRPVRAKALSGGHVLLRRSAVMAAGGLFDAGFFMYWEDSDLMRRLTLAGYTLCLEPRAQALHYYEHSPGKGALISRGWAAYASKHFNSLPWRLLGWAWARWPALAPRPPDFPVLTLEPGQPIRIDVPPPLTAGWLLECSISPRFVPAIGHYGAGPLACLPYALAQRVCSMDYFLRLSDSRNAHGASLCFVVRPAVTTQANGNMGPPHPQRWELKAP